MEKNIFILSIVFNSLALMSSGCKKDKNSLDKELSKLPAITQSGQNTFGCLVNGKAWVPKGSDASKPNSYIIIDPGYKDGDFSLRTYRIADNLREDYTINSDSIKTTGTYVVNDTTRTRVIYSKATPDLSQIFCKIYYRKGFLKIARYDLQAGIVSGEFEFSMVNEDCSPDTIKVTNGRFDYKL
jgi:hypothetical protein